MDESGLKGFFHHWAGYASFAAREGESSGRPHFIKSGMGLKAEEGFVMAREVPAPVCHTATFYAGL